MAKVPEKYEQPKDVPMSIPPETNKPTWPALAMPPKPGRTKIKGTGAAIKGTTFGKNG